MDQLCVKCLQDSAVFPKRSTEGAAGYDISAACFCTISTKGKGIGQTGLALVLPKGVYARIAPRSGFTIKKFINLGTGVVDNDYWVEVVLSPSTTLLWTFQFRWEMG